MSMLEIHQIYCQRFLYNLEIAQELLLNLKQRETAPDFELLYNCFTRECKKSLAKFDGIKGDNQKLLLQKQLHKICKNIDELSQVVPALKTSQLSPPEVVRHFEDQHQLKKILIKHMEDMEIFVKDSSEKFN